MSEDKTPRLLCDEMLHGLGRWLRAAGYDTAIAGAGTPDSAVLALAAAEGRILLTRDRELAERSGPIPVHWVEANDLDGQARELSLALSLHWDYQPFSRCTRCNTLLQPASEAQIASVPLDIRQRGLEPFHYCPSCGRVYWEGTHVRRMRATLHRLVLAARGAERED